MQRKTNGASWATRLCWNPTAKWEEKEGSGTAKWDQKTHLEITSAKAKRGNIGTDGRLIKMGWQRHANSVSSEKDWSAFCKILHKFFSFSVYYLTQYHRRSYACIACSKLKQKRVLVKGMENLEHQNNVEASEVAVTSSPHVYDEVWCAYDRGMMQYIEEGRG